MDERAPPYVFIASSSKGLDVAKAIKAELEGKEFELEVWNQDALTVGETILDELMDAKEKADFAIIVMTADDVVENLDGRRVAARDNVIFEAGLFMGALGKQRTLIACAEGVTLPVDLRGLLVARFTPPSKSTWRSAVSTAATQIKQGMVRAGPKANVHDALEKFRKSVQSAGEVGPGEQIYFEKLSQVLEASDPRTLSLVYADIDGLRNFTRKVFMQERLDKKSWRLENEVRADFVNVLNVCMTEAVYRLHPSGLKHDVFGLPDPDAVLVARKLPYDRATQVALEIQTTFRREASARWSSIIGDAGIGVSLLVCNAAFVDAKTKGVARVHRELRELLGELKDSKGRGLIFGHSDLKP